MSDIAIQKYYDICCDRCGCHRSTDFSRGMERSAKLTRKLAKREGWKHDKESEETLCPTCAGKDSNHE